MLREVTIILFILVCHAAMASGAYPYPVSVRQADGSYIQIRIHGDEFCRWTTNVWGHAVELDSAGMWRTVPSFSAAERDVVRAFNMGRMLNHSDSYAYQTKSTGSQVRNVRVLVVPVQFRDAGFVRKDYRCYLEEKLNAPGFSGSGASGSAKDYFEDNFPGYDFYFDVCDVVTLGNIESYYGHNDESVPSQITYDVNMPDLVRESCSALDASVDFSKYDQDSDGFIDHLIFVYAGYNEAEGGGSDSIWSHEWDLSAEKYRFDGVYVGLYAAAAELSGATGVNDAGIGTFCHELSHTFGLKDLYDVDYGNSGLCNCLWNTLSVMDHGNFNNGGHTPPYYCAIDRELAGTAVLKTFKAGDNVVMEPISHSGTAYKWNTGTEGEYYLFEVRTEEGWDRYIGGHGMLVYHIDKSDRYVAGIRASVRWDENLINTVSGHECADLVEAYGDASSIRQVFFPGQGSITEFGPLTIPAFESWNGESQLIRLDSIGEEGSSVSFKTVADSSEIMLHALNPTVTPYQTDAFMTWECEKQGAALWGVRWSLDGAHDYTQIEVNTTECTMSSLEVGRQYRTEIFHIGKSGNGDTASVLFTTFGYTSLYPYIYLPRTVYYLGETIDLKVLNVREDVNSIKWLLNDLRVEDPRVELMKTGSVEVKVILTYASDGSQECISRWITVKKYEDE